MARVGDGAVLAELPVADAVTGPSRRVVSVRGVTPTGLAAPGVSVACHRVATSEQGTGGPGPDRVGAVAAADDASGREQTPPNGTGVGSGRESTEGPTGRTPSANPDSDRARVLALLDVNGGRMRQTRIIEETNWSKSKVSALLSEMHETGTILKLRLGRENIICLDGEEPDLALSPSDDEHGYT